MLSSKLLSIGRLAEFAVGNVCLGNVGSETLPPSGRSHRGPDASLLGCLSCPGNRPNGPNRPNGVQDVPGRLPLRLGVGRFADGAAEPAHESSDGRVLRRRIG